MIAKKYPVIATKTQCIKPLRDPPAQSPGLNKRAGWPPIQILAGCDQPAEPRPIVYGARKSTPRGAAKSALSDVRRFGAAELTAE